MLDQEKRITKDIFHRSRGRELSKERMNLTMIQSTKITNEKNLNTRLQKANVGDPRYGWSPPRQCYHNLTKRLFYPVLFICWLIKHRQLGWCFSWAYSFFSGIPRWVGPLITSVYSNLQFLCNKLSFSILARSYMHIGNFPITRLFPSTSFPLACYSQLRFWPNLEYTKLFCGSAILKLFWKLQESIPYY